MFWEYEITLLPHENDLTVCFPEGNPRAFPCIGHPLGIGTTQDISLALPTVMAHLCHTL